MLEISIARGHREWETARETAEVRSPERRRAWTEERTAASASASASTDFGAGAGFGFGFRFVGSRISPPSSPLPLPGSSSSTIFLSASPASLRSLPPLSLAIFTRE